MTHGLELALLRLRRRLRQEISGGGIARWVPNYPVSYSSYWNQGKPIDEQSSSPFLSPDAETPAPDDAPESLTIEGVYDQIMGEQPGTTSDRATQWYYVESMLFYLQSELFSQTDSLEANWESPSAKEAYLSKVGETLAHIEVWREAASANHQGLALLAGAMRRAQTQMLELWERYRRELQDNTEQLAGSRLTDFRHEDRLRAWDPAVETKIENSSMVHVVRERYDQEARELISETADSYATAISKLETARARRMTPMNAILHPEAEGTPLDVPPLDSVPPPPAVPSAFNSPAPATRTTSPPAPTFNGTGPPMFGDPRHSKTAPHPPVSTSTSPGTPPAFARGSVAVPPPAYGIRSPQGPPGSGGTPVPSASGVPTPPTSGAKSPGNAPAPLPGTRVPGALAPRGNAGMPGTIMPPPGGGVPQKPNLKGKTLGRKEQNPAGPGMGLPGSIPPPPSGAPPSRKDDRKPDSSPNNSTSPQVDNAFRPPPQVTPPVIDTKKNVKRRARNETSTAAQLRPTSIRDATPSVLSNTRIEPKAAGNKRRKRSTGDAAPRQSEFAADVASGTVPVFEGRLAEPRQPSRQSLGDVPFALRGPANAGNTARDRDNAPVTQADRALRSAESAPSADSWDVVNPGGPIVSSDKPEGYRAEPKALGT
ncbi:hypothetical protein ABZ639_24425 [Saccharomonospora sp. NPDC006951]